MENFSSKENRLVFQEIPDQAARGILDRLDESPLVTVLGRERQLVHNYVEEGRGDEIMDANDILLTLEDEGVIDLAEAKSMFLGVLTNPEQELPRLHKIKSATDNLLSLRDLNVYGKDKKVEDEKAYEADKKMAFRQPEKFKEVARTKAQEAYEKQRNEMM